MDLVGGMELELVEAVTLWLVMRLSQYFLLCSYASLCSSVNSTTVDAK